MCKYYTKIILNSLFALIRYAWPRLLYIQLTAKHNIKKNPNKSCVCDEVDIQVKCTTERYPLVVRLKLRRINGAGRGKINKLQLLSNISLLVDHSHLPFSLQGSAEKHKNRLLLWQQDEQLQQAKSSHNCAKPGFNFLRCI